MLPARAVNAIVRVSAKICADILARFLAASIDAEMLGEIGVHFGFGETDDFGREFDERQATLPHEIVNRPPADVQAPGDLRLGFVIRRG